MKKNIILTMIVIFLSIILIILAIIVCKNIKTYNTSKSLVDSTLEFNKNNEEKIFSIDKITYFSSCNADISTNSNSSFTISNLYQYTDIAIFINQKQEEITHKNTLKSVQLSDITYTLSPNTGTPSLYYKNVNDFATSKYNKENIIDKTITFDTTSENEIDYSTPTLYNNCANPITLCYVNENIVDEYTLSNKISNIAHNGSLLKTCGITLNSISCKISFAITIINNLDETYSCPVTLTIPLSTEKSTIYDGSLTLKDSTKYDFIKL